MKTKIEVNTSWEEIGKVQNILQEISKNVESLPIKELNVSFRDSTDLKSHYCWVELKFEDGSLLHSIYSDLNNLFEWTLYKSKRRAKVITKGEGYLSELFAQVKNAL